MNDVLSQFLGGSPLSPPECDCDSEIDGCLFGGECSEITAVLNSVCLRTPPGGCPYIAATASTSLILTYRDLSTEDVAIWQYEAGGYTSTVTYTRSEIGPVACGWSAGFVAPHVSQPFCSPDGTIYTPAGFCELFHPPGSPCLIPSGTQQIAFPKNMSPEECIAHITEGCLPTCLLTWQAADISLFSPCKNTDLRCSGFRGFSGICLVNP